MAFKEIGNDINKIFSESIKPARNPKGFRVRSGLILEPINQELKPDEQVSVVETEVAEVYIPRNHTTVIANKKAGEVFELNLSSVARKVQKGATAIIIDESRLTPNFKVEILDRRNKQNSRNARVILKVKVLE